MLVLMRDRFPEFRLGSVLATSFTGTRSERHGEPIERIPTAGRLRDWLSISGLAVDSCSDAELEQARSLREAIHESTTAVAADQLPPAAAVELINRHSEAGRAVLVLDTTRKATWRLRASAAMTDALGVIAVDAIDVISGRRDGRLALCDSPTCRAAFFDTSRSRTRRWCDMGICGNQHKKARYKARHTR